MAEPLKIPASNIRVHQDHVGGGFGSKFSPDRWGIVTAELSKKAGGKPVRLMLERDTELKVAGARPSAYARVKVGAAKDGTVVAWQSQSWGTGGPGGGGMVNFVMIGSQKDVQAALQAANWFVADTSNSGAVTKAILMTYENKDYLQMPMSQLYLFGRVQDFGYEQAEPYSVVASRHHFRLWKAPFQVDGQDVWVGAGTHARASFLAAIGFVRWRFWR